LYLETDYVRSGFRRVAQWLAEQRQVTNDERQVAGIANALWQEFLNDPRNVFDRFAESNHREHRGRGEKKSDLVQAMIEVYRGHEPTITPCPDVPEALARLATRGVTVGVMTPTALAIFSDGDPVRQQLKLDALGIGELFRKVVFTGQNPAWHKPAPEGFSALSETLGCRPCECVYVADNPAKDFLGPNQIGMRSIRVRRAAGLHASLEPAPGCEPETTITNLAGLPVIIQEMNLGIRIWLPSRSTPGNETRSSLVRPSLNEERRTKNVERFGRRTNHAGTTFRG
jgi:putative hydrolase of the HAD superfamily